MKVFVAGATGAVGRPTVRQLVAAGHDVVGLTRRQSNASMLKDLGARPAVADVFDRDAVHAALAEARPEGVIDLLTALPSAGPIRASDMEATNRIRLEGTANVLDAALAAGAGRYVAESIAFIYRWTDAPGRATEDTPLLDMNSLPPGVAKSFRTAHAKEQRVLETSRAKGVEGIVLRFGAFYGPGTGGTDAIIGMARRRRLFLPGRGQATLPWIHVEDAAAATVAALERGRAGQIYNVVDDGEASVAAFVEELTQQVGLPGARSIPTWLSRFAASYATWVFNQPRLRVSNAKAKRDLGWVPVFPTYREGIEDVAAVVTARGRDG